METLQAFKNDASLKEAMLREVKKHEEADAIVQGTYGSKNGTWKGCAVACSLRSLAIVHGEKLVTDYSQHERYETDLGIPRVIARLEDQIFEGLPVEAAKKFPLRFIEAVNVGADMRLVWPQFAVWLLVDEQDGVIKYAKEEKTKKAIQDVSDAYKKVVAGEVVELETWRTLRAASDAAYSAAAASDAAYASARSDFYVKCADKLIEIIQQTH